MPNLSYSVADFLPFTKIVSADVNTRFNDIKTLLNTTKLDSTNVQQYGLTRDRMNQTGNNQVVINDSSGTMTSEAQLAVSRGGLGSDFSGSLASNAGNAVVVNNAGNAFSLGSPIQATLTETLNSNVNTITAGEAITANQAVCVDFNNSNYRIFLTNDSKATRRIGFLGFATAAATVTPQIQTWVASANFVTSNSIAFTINSRNYTVAFTTDNATTLQAVATAMATDPDVNGAVSDGVHTVTVTGKGALQISITGSTVTGGASQPTITVTTTQAFSGQNVPTQVFGPMAGFTSLTTGAYYYISATPGAITTVPPSSNPVFVGQALSSTVLFINKNVQNFQFPTSTAFVRAFGSSTNVESGATKDVEHYNFVSWSAGTSSGGTAVSEGTPNGSLAYNGTLLVLDGYNSATSITSQFQSYNKSAWSTLTTRGTAKVFQGAYAFGNNKFYSAKGGTGVASTTNESWNGSAWSTTNAYVTAENVGACFVQGSLMHHVTGIQSNAHETMNSSDTIASATNAPTTAAYSGGSVSTTANGLYINSTTTASYYWNGSSWSSSTTVSYTPSGSSYFNPSCGYSPTTQLSIINGGSTASAALNTSASFNDVSWSSATASTNARGSGVGGVF